MRNIGDYIVDDLSAFYFYFIFLLQSVQTVVFDIIFKRDSNKEIQVQTGDFSKCFHSNLLFFPRERIVSFVILIVSY